MNRGRALSQGNPRRLLPVVARAFAQLGYRRATTAQLARRCGVRENVLYRAWPSKRAMFIASIGYVFDNSLKTWKSVLADGSGGSADARRPHAARLVLDYESAHHGEHGLYRIVFAALNESHDAKVRAALRDMYARFHGFIQSQLPNAQTPTSDIIAWSIVGLGTVLNITRELELLGPRQRRSLMREVGSLLLERSEATR